PPPIELERALAGALAADPAAHPVSAAAALAQPRREVAQARDLDLQPRLARLGVAVEDLEDDRCPIEDVGAGRLLEVALLGRRQVVIDEDDARPPPRGISLGRRLGAASRPRRTGCYSIVVVIVVGSRGGRAGRIGGIARADLVGLVRLVGYVPLVHRTGLINLIDLRVTAIALPAARLRVR